MLTEPGTNIWEGYRKVKDGLFLRTLAVNLIVFGSHLLDYYASFATERKSSYDIFR